MRLFSDASASINDQFLRHAFRLAERGRGRTAPNPIVGSVVVSHGEIIGEGFHDRAGGPHAEVVALAEAGERARGATVYVTLEPCSHYGATPPCTSALIEAGVSAVVIGATDPTHVAGGGATVLADAGIDVTFAEDPQPFIGLTEAWRTRVATGLPWVQVKAASSLDGALALAEETRSAITGAGGREVTMRLRAAADAVCIGARTARIDAPALTVRDADGRVAGRQPLRIVLARSEVDPGLPLFGDGLGPVAIVCHDDVAPAGLPAEVDVIGYAADEGIRGALRAIAARGVDHLLIETGPRLLTALWDGHHIDELVTVHAGGMAGTRAPRMYRGGGASGANVLVTPMYAVESGVADQDAVTVWRPDERPGRAARQEGR